MTKSLRIILFGVPGCGKGTQAAVLSKQFSVPVISTGDILRQEIANSTEIGVYANSFVKKGELVPDQVVIDIIKNRLQLSDCANGYILDGFPRTHPQAQALDDAGVKIEHVIYISVPKEDVVVRLSGRRVHTQSGRVYHIAYNPPKIAGKDDVTGEDLVQRVDDSEDVVRNRLAISDAQISALEHYYSKHSANFVTINGNRPVEQVTKDIVQVVTCT
jgi:adenylate kinase